MAPTSKLKRQFIILTPCGCKSCSRQLDAAIAISSNSLRFQLLRICTHANMFAHVLISALIQMCWGPKCPHVSIGTVLFIMIIIIIMVMNVRAHFLLSITSNHGLVASRCASSRSRDSSRIAARQITMSNHRMPRCPKKRPEAE